MTEKVHNFIVTGGCGFIGGHLVNRLINNGHEVRGVDIKPLDEWHQVFEKSKRGVPVFNDKHLSTSWEARAFSSFCAH